MLDRLKDSLKAWESSVPHMYLDTVGVTTCGIGHAIFSPEMACALSWERGATGVAASPQEIMQEYHRVMAMERGMVASYYAMRTVLRLPKEAITDLLDSDIAAKQTELAAHLPGLLAFPEPVQCALLDMAFNLGVHGLTSGFPHLMVAVLAEHWLEAAQHCHRKDIAEPRNAWTAKLFLEAAMPRT